MYQAAQGAFASSNPRVVTLAGVASFRAAEPDGLTVGIFGWGDIETGRAANVRTAEHQRLGFVLPVQGGCYPVRRDARGRAVIRPGYQITMASAGDFWTVFEGGASRGDRVYARLLDGAPLSGYAADAEPTPWRVVTEAEVGGLAIITSWSTFDV